MITITSPVSNAKCRLVKSFATGCSYAMKLEPEVYHKDFANWENPTDAWVEGSEAEWRLIAQAIRIRYTEIFKRCAVIFQDRECAEYFEYVLPPNCVAFESPRNTNNRPFLLTYEAAEYFASTIDQLLGK